MADVHRAQEAAKALDASSRGGTCDVTSLVISVSEFYSGRSRAHNRLARPFDLRKGQPGCIG